MPAVRRVLLALLTLTLAVTLGGCGKDAPVTTEPLPGEGDTGQLMLDGQALVSERCTVCHDLARVDEAAYDDVGWEATVDRMITKGAKLTEDEKVAVIEYLSNR